MRDNDWALLDTLYQHSSLSKAAEALYISQPALTKRLQKIEEEFGAAIAVRTSKGLTLTPQGELLAAKATEYLLWLERTKKEFQSRSDGAAGTIRIGLPQSVVRFFFPSIERDFRSLFPNVDFDIRIEHSGVLAQLKQEQKLHLVFVRGQRDFDGCQLCLRNDPCVILHKEPFALEDLPDIPYIEYTRDPSAHKNIEEWWYRHFDKPPRKGSRANSIDTSREMVLQGLGFTFCSIPEDAYDNSDLYVYPMRGEDGQAMCQATYLLYSPEDMEVPLLANFITFMKRRCP